MNKPIEPILTKYLIDSFGEDVEYCEPSEVREIEKQRDELLEAVIEIVADCEKQQVKDSFDKEGYRYFRHICKKYIDTIEKAYDKTWTEIMESRE